MTWSRRHFVRTSALGLAASALPAPLLARALDPRGRATDLVELRRGVGLYQGRGGTIGWLASADGTLVVDSQFPDTAAAFLEALEARGAARIDALVNTHHHGDHTAGNPVFRDVVGQIVAHERAVELQRAAAERAGNAGDQAYADATFADRWALEVGDETVRARHYRAAHTGGDVVVVFERAGVVHMGDLVFNRLYPFIDRAGGASVAGWIALLGMVADEQPRDALYIFGHGRAGFGVTGSRADLLLQRDFLAALLETARRAIAAGASRDEATARDSLYGFPDHVPPAARLTLGAALGAAYDELAERR